MARATCALCGGQNSIGRVYAAMRGMHANLVAVACTHCGRSSSQLRSLGEYLGFAAIYSMACLLLLLIGVLAVGGRVRLTWIALASATLPFLFLPAWWSMRQADALAAAAPQQDLSLRQKLGWLSIALLLIGLTIAGGLAGFLAVLGR